MIRTIIFLTIICFIATGCSLTRVSSNEVTTNYYPAKNTTNEVVYQETISQPHEIIGFVTVNTERNQEMQEIIALMRREAAILGGDAISNITSDSTGTWKKVPPQKILNNAYVRANFTATIVAFK